MTSEFDADRLVGDVPSRSLDDWHQAFAEDRGLPITSSRPIIGPLLVLFRRLLRPLVRLPLNDLLERERVFNLIVIERLRQIDALREELTAVEHRVASLEASYRDGLEEVMRYSDALYSRVDVKLEGYAHSTREHLRLLRAMESAEDGALAKGGDDPAPEAGVDHNVVDLLRDADYLAFENEQRGAEELIADRARQYLDCLPPSGRLLDLGCGRGEALAVFREAGLEVRGVDSNRAMVAECRERGFEVALQDLLDALRSQRSGSLDVITCFHVIEHLPVDVQVQMLELAERALAPGGVLIVETPNPESLRVGARDFWIDATHLRPVHPTGLLMMLQQVGFRDVEIRRTQPFEASERLPEIASSDLEGDAVVRLADRVNRLRDRLDQLLFGSRDFAAVAHKVVAQD